MKKKTEAKRSQSQQAVFELKQKVVVALNKLGDRDTYQVAAEELHRAAEAVGPEGIGAFLWCIVDAGAEQKSAVRRECVALMGTMVRHHGALMAPHVGKMVAGIVKRLRDTETAVREACVETVGAVAKLGGGELVRPFFEGLGEQNKQVQEGSAMCLASVVSHHTHHSPSLLHRMLLRTTKLLNNPHFLAKPALLHLNATLILALPPSALLKLHAPFHAILLCLTNSDWHTRKAASAALATIALTSPSFACFRSSCLHSLESCRFDKVKPVRDTALHALHCWSNLPQPPSSHSSSSSSIKEDFNSESAPKDQKFAAPRSSAKPRIPLSVRRKMSPSPAQPQLSNHHDRHLCVQPQLNNADSECSSVTKNFERMSTTDITSLREDIIGYDYVHMDDDKQDSSSVSNFLTHKFETKDSLDHEMRLVPSVQIREDRASLDSTVTDSSSPAAGSSSHRHTCCLPMANEIAGIQKQLVQIENKQSNLMDLFQVFTRGLMDNLGVLQSRVVHLENAVDGRHSSAMSKMMSSPRESRSNCTPRPSVDLHNHKRQAETFSCSVSVWKRVRGFMCEGDVESAYAEALCSRDERVILELLDSTGPVLQCLSSRNASALLTALASFLMQHKFTASLLPWLQQVVELSNIHGLKHVVVSTKARQKLLSALEEAGNMDFSNPLDKRCITQIAVKLHNIWGGNDDAR